MIKINITGSIENMFGGKREIVKESQMNPIKLTNFKDLNGKTIEDSLVNGDELYLKFTDNSFCVLGINDVSNPFGYRKEEISIDDYRYVDETDSNLVKLGLISQEQFNNAMEQERLLEEEFERHQQEIEQNRIKENELKEFNRIKEKYNLNS